MLMLLLGVVAEDARAQFSAQPVILELATVDSAASSRFTVRNESAEELQLRISAGDFDQPVSGGHEFFEAGTHERSCAARLEFFPESLVLGPGESGEVTVRMAPGAATCWSLVFVQTVLGAQGGVRIAHRIGIKVYGVSSAALPEGEVSHVEVMEDSAGVRSAVVEFTNASDVPVRPTGEVEIRTMSGDVVAVVPVEPFSVLPGHARRTTVVLDATLDPGTYLAIPILDFGGEYLAGGQATFRVGG